MISFFTKPKAKDQSEMDNEETEKTQENWKLRQNTEVAAVVEETGG